MGEAGGGRWVAFGVVCAVITISAVLFAGGGEKSPAPDGGADEGVGAFELDSSTRALLAEAESRRREAASAARGFLRAYFQYEVGRLGARVRRGLRRWSTSKLANDLLRAPPRPPAVGEFPSRAELRELSVTLISADASRAVVNGHALRDGLPEDVSFVFVRVGGEWRASRPGE